MENKWYNRWYCKLMLTIIGSVIAGLMVIWLAQLTISELMSIVFNGITGILSWAWSKIISLLNYKIPVWIIISIPTGVYLVLRIVRHYTKVSNSNHNIEPPFLSYTQDRFENWIWKWSYQRNSSGQYQISNLHPLCPNCETPLIGWMETTAQCADFKCGYRLNDNTYVGYTEYPENSDRIGVLIEDKIKKNNYPTN